MQNNRREGQSMKKLTKSARDRQVSGVLGGLAEYFGIDSTIVRIVFLIFAFAGVGSPIFLYFLLALLMPEPDRSNRNQEWYAKRGKSTTRRAPKEVKPLPKEDKDTDDWSDF